MANEEKASSSPFRQQALEYIATPKALDDFVQVTPPSAWALAIALWLIAGAFIVWIFFGAVVTHVGAKGMVLTQNEAVLYISALETGGLHPGVTVHVSPDVRKQWEYKRIPGTVTSIENLPTTPEEMLQTLKNPSLVKYFLKAGPVVALRVQMPDSLPPGSLIDARITTRRQTPLSLVLPR
jgi:hypothetical protein